jgi:decaprenylphospho-beta-D-erythro-pentofuranosid-2-ulose 2-reductase
MLNAYKEVQKVLLIGSTSEIGIATVIKLPAAKDSRLILVGRSKPDLVELSKVYSCIDFIECNLLLEKDLQALFLEFDRLGDVDVAVIAAGVLGSRQETMVESEILEIFQINGVSAIRILKQISDKMKSQQHGCIGILSSVAGLRPRRSNYVYGASKAVADFYARGISQELNRYNVSISVIRPGFVFTKMTAHLKPSLFAANPNSVGKIAASGIMKRKNVI